jgi:NAD(P)-dependent dehydrogenase (short-subunit alcohol dehydrogenase family)
MTNTTVALVTGGNKGIGYEIVRQLAERGMTVLLAARDKGRREDAVATLRAAGAQDVHPLELDVTDPATAEAAATHIEETYGHLDVLVNNAGIGGVRATPSGSGVDAVRAVFDVNYFGVLTVTNAMLPLLLRSPAPRIVNVSSGLGSLALAGATDGPVADLPASAAYIPSKTALNMLTVQYAKELRGRVLVNAADPGYCATDLNNFNGYRTPAQGAAIAVHLATLPDGGPTGGYVNDDGTVPW